METLLQNLIAAEKKADQLFNEAEARGYIIAGQTEKELNTKLYDLAFELFGIKKYWHKRIVRSGVNTLAPYRENPPDLILQEDDILFFDFGPVFEDFEADFGRTFVIGNDVLKHKLKNDVEAAWQESRVWFLEHTHLTGAEYFEFNVSLAAKYGWEWGGPIAGHLVGQFPHEKLQGENKSNYIHPKCKKDMFALDAKGNPRFWILEIHFINTAKQIGGFYEQLLYRNVE